MQQRLSGGTRVLDGQRTCRFRQPGFGGAIGLQDGARLIDDHHREAQRIQRPPLPGLLPFKTVQLMAQCIAAVQSAMQGRQACGLPGVESGFTRQPMQREVAALRSERTHAMRHDVAQAALVV